MRTRRGRTFLGLLGIFAASACGPRTATGLEGRLVLDLAPSRGDFADSALVRKADAQITELLGHPVSFHFDAAVTPRWDVQLQALSEASIDAVAHELASIKRQSPEMFAWMAPRFRRVEWDYHATRDHAVYTFDPSSGTLRIELTSEEWSMVREGFIRLAVGRAYAAAQGARFAGATPTGVSPSDRGAYASFLLGPAAREEAKAHPPVGDDQTVERPRAHVLLELLRFSDAVRGQDAELDAKLTARLVEEASYVARVRRNHAELAARLPRDHEFVRAEAAYVAWLERSEPTLPDAARVKIAEEIRTSAQDDGTVHAFPGFDPVAHYLRVLDAWAKAGAPTRAERDGDRARQELFDLVVAPTELRAGDGTGCGTVRAPVYQRIATDAQARRRVFEAVLGKHDERVTKIVMARLLVTDVDLAIAFWRATEPEDAAFRATTRVIAGNLRCTAKTNAFFDVTPELWRKYPARRGLLAYLLHKFGTFSGPQNGADFAKVFGPLAQADFAAELAEEEDPMREVHFVWNMLGRGWSRMDVLAPRLDGWLAAPRYKTDTSWTEGVRAISSDLCAEKATSDLARLHDWIEARVRAHPSELGMLKLASERTAPGGCPKHD